MAEAAAEESYLGLWLQIRAGSGQGDENHDQGTQNRYRFREALHTIYNTYTSSLVRYALLALLATATSY